MGGQAVRADVALILSQRSDNRGSCSVEGRPRAASLAISNMRRLAKVIKEAQLKETDVFRD